MARSTKQTLIEAAYELFGRHGFHMIGLDRIIADAGVSKQTFYNHFASKDELILAVLAARHEAESKKFAQLFKQVAGPDPKAQLYALFDVLEVWFNEPEFRGCIFLTAAAEFPSHHDPVHIAANDHEQSVMENLQYLATLAGASHPRVLAEQLLLLLNGAIVYRHISGGKEAARIAKQTATPLLDRYFEPSECPPRRGMAALSV
ncbi:MAG TPA: TetR/AcrR family transcriptional regulator [Tepidisphaeraceae bacterium]|jgi:AcrR family transcriptional regulator|nr:TetR/AcrR family transcriptional regulator [Tepidisphaeraceae bacterium]